MAPARLTLANLPTPLFRHPALDALVGCELWVKRDDMNAGPEAGNKVRKLEYLLADAEQQGATVVITCGGLQSNHARATALLARQRGLDALLLLRSSEPAPRYDRGNAFLDRLVGARIRIITPEMYRDRDRLMLEAAGELSRQGERPYVIPEGGSNGLGAFGYVEAMREVRAQLDRGEAGGPARFDAVAHACGSGGTAAGVWIGAAEHGVAEQTLAFAVCDDSAYFEAAITRIRTEAVALGAPRACNQLRVLDRWKGPAYAVADAAQLEFIRQVARRSGLLLDPVYTGKALYGLSQLEPRPTRVLFIHSGGLPGLLAEADRFEPPV
jgi:D-cysteine desulfhydrase